MPRLASNRASSKAIRGALEFGGVTDVPPTLGAIGLPKLSSGFDGD